MSHLVDTLAYPSVREMPWHGLGNAYDPADIHSWSDMRMAAGLMWEPGSCPVAMPPLGRPDAPLSDWEIIPGWQGIRRDDNGHVLHAAQDSYTPIYHHEMGEILSALMGTGEEKLEWDTAGALREGAQVFATVAVGDAFHIGDDPSPNQRFIALLNSHDGSSACRAIETTVRIVCANTWHLADMTSTKQVSVHSFRHTSGWHQRLEEARTALGLAKAAHDETRAELEMLAQIPFSDDQYDQFITRFVPVDADRMTPRALINAKADQEKFRYVADPGNVALDGIRNTAYGVVQAAGEYLDHYRAFRNEDTYVRRTLLSPNEGKAIAKRLAIKIHEDAIGARTVIAV